MKNLSIEVRETYRLSRPQLGKLVGVTRQGNALWEKGTKPSVLHRLVLTEFLTQAGDYENFAVIFKTLAVILKEPEEKMPKMVLKMLFGGG